MHLVRLFAELVHRDDQNLPGTGKRRCQTGWLGEVTCPDDDPSCGQRRGLGRIAHAGNNLVGGQAGE